MAISFFKNLTHKDIKHSKTILHEHIPMTGTILSGTYQTASSSGREVNIKTFSHGMFQSVYDYPYLSSSANKIFDITAGFSTLGSTLSASATSQVSKKVNIYNQMAQVLVGYNPFSAGNSVRRFDQDGNLSGSTQPKHDNVIFLNFSRLLVKDEIKKGSFSLNLGIGATYATPFSTTVNINDSEATGSYKINSPAGEYGLLKSGSINVGLIYYQAGIAVMTSSVFNSATQMNATLDTIADLITGSNIDAISDALRHRIKNITFNNTTELNSALYFCRANNTEFNYSSNPTYLSQSTIRVREVPGTSLSSNQPRSYATTVGLYSHDNELLAVAKLSEPLVKTPDNELTVRVRLDY